MYRPVVFTHKILKNKDISAVFPDFIIPAVDINSYKTLYATQGNLKWSKHLQRLTNL